jgi:CHAT domain-containing protein
MGSLWGIRDDVTRDLVVRFYTELKDPGVTKAEALQRAQIEQLRRGAAAGEWSPFVLIGNWL